MKKRRDKVSTVCFESICFALPNYSPDVNFVCCGRNSGDVSDVEAAVPAPVSSHKEEDGSEEMEEAMDAQNAPIEVQSQEDEGEAEKGDAAVEAVPARATRARRQRAVLSVAEEVMPARATRARSHKKVVPVAEEEAPKGRRTSRRAKTSMQQTEEEKRTQGKIK
jgi:hypothetical protein